MMMTQ